ncbi:transposase [Anaerobacillus alkaliphilus]|uniref:Transposase n=1 Tax=Anaerobacillus alkaliphilus TaxID=1548597 RepID=A0A4V1LGX9_9BACI|nr:transposase [Anaerobacillus alkaliphilus]RXJ04295.1 transposase [Anaerobacillus alkaliphilus]
MKLLLIIGSILVPLVMILLQLKWPLFRLLFHILALLSALIFGNISSTSIHEILIDETVFMTNIHGVFLNPVFLITGAYLGLYLIYIIALSTIYEIRHQK